MSDRQVLLRQFSGQLKSFQTSRTAFTVFAQVTRASLPASATPSTQQGRHEPKPRALVVLDSSFNPPTLAHMRMAASAVRALRKSSPSPDDVRVLLLLAVNNADKAPDKPVAFPLRMEMMRLFALDLLRVIDGGEAGRRGEDASPEPDDTGMAIDLGLTTMPYFHDKSRAIVDSGHYKDAGKDGAEGAATEGNPEQVVLAGYDTLVRIFNPKYYAGSGGIRAALDPFFGGARLRVTMRTDDKWGAREDQLAYLEGLQAGKLEEVGGRGAWCDRVDLVEGDQEAVSSTRVREAARTGNAQTLEALVSPRVKDFILEGELYAQDE